MGNSTDKVADLKMLACGQTLPFPPVFIYSMAEPQDGIVQSTGVQIQISWRHSLSRNSQAALFKGLEQYQSKILDCKEVRFSMESPPSLLRSVIHSPQ